MKRVLFVDAAPRVPESLKRMLRPLRQEWEMDFAAGGREALWHLAESNYDVLVTGIHMPDIDGIALLSEAIRISSTDRSHRSPGETIWIRLWSPFRWPISIRLKPNDAFTPKPL